MAFALVTKPKHAAAVPTKTPRQRETARINSTKPATRPAIQAKLKVGEANDSFEQEADDVAEKIMRMPENALTLSGNRTVRGGGLSMAGPPSVQRMCAACAEEKELQGSPLSLHAVQRLPLLTASPLVQRACAACAAEKDEKLRRKPLPQPARAEAQPLEAEEGPINNESLKSGGGRLESATKHFFEARFNRDLSNVSIHTGPRANEFCERLDAHAFTYGNHIWLGPQHHAAPSFVLAHELAHVVQQMQPHALKAKRANESASCAQGKPPNTVQRLPFWVPLQDMGVLMTGSAIHKELLKDVEGRNQVRAEAPVPNAIRSDTGLGLQGFADLYRASSRVGVYFNPRAGLEVANKTGDDRFTKPAKPDRAGTAASPIANARGGIDRIKSGPAAIEIGELKPAALTELKKGHDQLDNYKTGFEDAKELTNEWAANQGLGDTWRLSSVTRLPDGAVQAPRHDPGNPANIADRDIALADIDEVKSEKGKKERVKYTVKKLFVPDPQLGQNIQGKLFLEPFGQGLWMYYARPNDFNQALNVVAQAQNLTELKRARIAMWAGIANSVQNEVIGNLQRGPQRITFLRRGRPNAVQLNLKPAASQPVIHRKPKEGKLKDDFDATKYEAWSKRQSDLGNQLRGQGKYAGSKDASAFKALQFLELAAKAEDVLPPKVRQKTPNFPKPADLKESIASSTEPKKAIKQTSLDKLYNWLERWTSEPYKILGQFRLRFGTVFVTAVNKFLEIKESIHTKVKEFFEKRSKEKHSERPLVNALTVALKQVINILVPQTLRLVFESIVKGIKRKLEALFDDTFVGKSIEKFKTWWEEIKGYADKAKEYFTKIKEDFLKKFEWADELLNDIKWFWGIVKTGRALLKCARPLGLGCLRLLIPSSGDLDCILCIPKVQKMVAEKVMGLSWFSNIPKKLANLILGALKDAVPDKVETLRDIFEEQVPEENPDLGELEPECKADCSGFGLFKISGGSGGEVKEGDVETAKKLAELNDKLSEQQKEDLLKEAERRGMLDKPYDEQQTQKLLKDLEKKQPKPAEPPKTQDPTKPETKAPPKTEEEKRLEEKAKEAEKQKQAEKPSAPSPSAKKPSDITDPQKQKGQGQAAGGACAWTPSMLDVHAWILERLDPTSAGGEGGHNILKHGTTIVPFDKAPIKRDCEVSLETKNDFFVGGPCGRPGGFASPALSTEIVFKSKDKTKVIFKREEKKSEKSYEQYFVEPSWGSFIKLDPIWESGNLQLKITMRDPDTGVVKLLVENVAIDIRTKGKDDQGKEICCNCVS
jgi:hypothetical protein